MEKGNDKFRKSVLGPTGVYANKEQQEKEDGKTYNINISSNLLSDYFPEPSSNITGGTNYTRYMSAGGGEQKSSTRQADGMSAVGGEDVENNDTGNKKREVKAPSLGLVRQALYMAFDITLPKEIIYMHESVGLGVWLMTLQLLEARWFLKGILMKQGTFWTELLSGQQSVSMKA